LMRELFLTERACETSLFGESKTKSTLK
jgi:hypothetical protein